MYIVILSISFEINIILYLDYSFVVKKFTTLINTLVTTDMDFTQLEAFLSSQMKKKQVMYIEYICVLCFKILKKRK